MFLLVRKHRVFSLLAPLGGFHDLDFKIESILAKNNLKLGRLHSMIIGYCICERLQEPLFFATGHGTRRGHKSKLPPRLALCLFKTDHRAQPEVLIATPSD